RRDGGKEDAHGGLEGGVGWGGRESTPVAAHASTALGRELEKQPSGAMRPGAHPRRIPSGRHLRREPHRQRVPVLLRVARGAGWRDRAAAVTPSPSSGVTPPRA